jgi:acyl-coenzyme A thioesterase PaaI-like protein
LDRFIGTFVHRLDEHRDSLSLECFGLAAADDEIGTARFLIGCAPAVSSAGELSKNGNGMKKDSLESKLQRNLRENLPLYEYMDLRIECASDGIFRCVVPMIENNMNHFRSIHAALQWAAAEVLGGLVWAISQPEEGEFVPVIRRFEIDFKRPAYGDIVAETRFSEEQADTLKSELNANGRYDFVLESEVRNLEEETLAIGKGFYAIRDAAAISKK